jgi:eukaryotic-like serine/threonine-protein kinase
MVCSRCGVGEVSEQTRECNVCGFSPGGGVLTEASLLAELDLETRHAVEGRCHPERLLRRTRRSILCLAEERGTERQVALKILHLGGSEAERVAGRFRHEMTRATALDHLHLVRIRDFGASVSTCWYTMDYVASQSVADLLRERATLELTTVLRIVQQVTGALAYLHRDGLTHGNLKPSNILIDAAGWVRLSDYGLTRALGGPPPWNRSALPEGAAPYLAPESFVSTEPLGPSADQYALAVVVHECLAGTTRISRKSLEASPSSVGRAADRPELAPEVAGALRPALATQPSERFPDILEFAAALAEAWTPEGATTDAPRRSSEGRLLFMDAPTPPAPPERRRASRVLVATAAVSLAVIGGVAALLFWPQAAPSPVSIPAAVPDSMAVADTGGGPSPIAASSAPGVGRSREAVAPSPITPTPRPAAGAPLTVPRARRALPGHVLVNSTPWSDLSVDGQPVGHTPKADLLLAPGPHRLRFTRDGFEPYETVIQVSPGATIRLTDIALKEAAP